MISLNLVTKSVEEEALKQYLEENASEVLADKINNGVRIEKNGKTVINKKTIETFMDYAAKEAQAQAEKGARYACIRHEVVFGWAIHYFEEESIEGILYNEDGTPYKAEKSKPVKTNTPVPKPVVKKENKSDQLSLFDFGEEIIEEKEEVPTEIETTEEITIENNEDSLEEIEAIEEVVVIPEKAQVSALYKRYLALKDKYPTALIAMRVGDFYELFDDAARLVGEKLELTIVSRDFGLPERTPMVGFPYHVEEQYRKKIQDFATVAIAENEDDVKIYLKRQEETPNHRVNTATGEIIEERSEVVNDLIGILFGIFKNEMEVKM